MCHLFVFMDCHFTPWAPLKVKDKLAVEALICLKGISSSVYQLSPSPVLANLPQVG